MIMDLALQRNSRHEVLHKSHHQPKLKRSRIYTCTYPCLGKVLKLKTPLQSLSISRQRPPAAIRYKQLVELGGLRGHESGVSEARAGEGNILVGYEYGCKF